MADQRKSRARAAAEEHEAGLDVWVPALVAIAAAFFLILSASAQEAPPRTIYNAERFAMSEAERTMLEERAAHTGRALAAVPVEMQALPELRVTEPRAEAAPPGPPPVAARPATIADRDAAGPTPGWVRLAMALVIAAMLGGALYLLDRTWRRTGPADLTGAQAAA